MKQIWNHNLYWKSLSPTGGGEPSGSLLAAIEESYGTYEDFQTEFTSVASGHFGSGWAWLIVYDDNTIDVSGRRESNVCSACMEAFGACRGQEGSP